MYQVATYSEHRHLNAQMIINRDPTRTTVLRNLFVRDMNRRFNELKKVIAISIVKEDCFALKDDVRITLLEDMVTTGIRAFNFPRNTQKVSGFMDWIKRQTEAGILDVRDITQIGESIEGAWTNKYVFDSYKRGVIRARIELKNAGFEVPSITETGGIQAVMMAPIHLDRVGLLYTRAFNELRGITSAMDKQISQVLAQGLIDGEGPRTLAKRLVQTVSGKGRSLELVDSLGRTIGAQRRATILARTETIRAHAQGTLQEYKNWGAVGVSVKAEFITAGDNRVCAQCANLQGSVFVIKDAWNIIPVHAQCRCAWIPLDTNEVPVAPGDSITDEIKADKVASNMKLKTDAESYLKFKKEWQSKLDDLFKNDPKLLKDIKAWQSDVDTLTKPKLPRKIQSFINKDEGLKKFMSVFDGWQTDTFKNKPLLFKMRAEKIEKIGKTLFPTATEQSFIDGWAKLISTGTGSAEVLSTAEYLNGRAFGQAWLKATRSGKKSWDLFRGTDGKEGESFVNTLKNFIINKAGDQKAVFNWSITDSSMAGYTEQIKTAHKFGATKGGVTIRNTFKANEVFWPRDLITGYSGRYSEELEWVVQGLQKKVLNFKDLEFKFYFTSKTGRARFLEKLMGESLDDFMVRFLEVFN